MIYLVTNNKELFNPVEYKYLSVSDSLKELETWDIAEADSETTGLNPHINSLICFQLGNKKKDIQIVIDCTSVDIKIYKEFLEKTLLIFHNAKFDLQFLYKQGIVPRKVYDTMVAEQVFYMGFSSVALPLFKYKQEHYDFPYLFVKDSTTVIRLSFSLKAVLNRYLHIDIDKSIRDDISSLGLTPEVIYYAAHDVMYLEDVRDAQLSIAKERHCEKAVDLECNFIPSLAYMEWCGVHLDQEKWKAKMEKDLNLLNASKKALDTFVENMVSSNSQPNHAEFEEEFHISTDGYGGHEEYPLPQGARIIPNSGWSVSSSDSNTYNYVKIARKFPFCTINLQGDLFTGFDTSPHCIINWSSSSQVVKFVKFLGFDTQVKDKKTGGDKDTVIEKRLKVQKGINDEFLKLYFDYQEHFKTVTSFGQGHLDAINPITGRLHTKYNGLGASSGRLSCGGGTDEDLCQYKKLPKGSCKLLNLQQLPHDAETRACFTAEEGNLWVSCDFSAEEARILTDVTKDPEYYKEFTERTGDTHALYAWACYEKECRALGCESALDVKKKAKKFRDQIKSAEFAYNFGASPATIAETAGISVKEAEDLVRKMDSFFSGLTAFKRQAAADVKAKGYIDICPETGHRLYWWDWKEWVANKSKMTQDFWEEYRAVHKGTGDSVALFVKAHSGAADKYAKLGLNAKTQGTGAIIFKDACTNLFNWIVDSKLFNKVKICVGVHDKLIVVVKLC